MPAVAEKILVTGASSGIGAEPARLCGERGARVALLARDGPGHPAPPTILASRGRMVLMASLTGLVAIPGRSVYSAPKFGMRGLADA